MSSKARPTTTRRAPSNGKVFVKIAGLWVAMICGSFLLGWLVVSPLMRAASPEKQPKDTSGAQSPTPQTAQVNNNAPAPRRGPGPAINIAPDEEQKHDIQQPETDITTPQQQSDENGGNSAGQAQELDTVDHQADSGATRRRANGDDLSVEDAPAASHRRATSPEQTEPAAQNAPEPGSRRESSRRLRNSAEPSPRTRSKQPVQKSDSID